MLAQACDGHLLYIFSAQSMAFSKSFHFQVNQLMFGEGTRERKKKKKNLYLKCVLSSGIGCHSLEAGFA